MRTRNNDDGVPLKEIKEALFFRHERLKPRKHPRTLRDLSK